MTQAKVHPRHRMLLFLSKIHGKQQTRLLDINEREGVIEIFDSSLEDDIGSIHKDLLRLKKKIKKEVIGL